MEFNERDGGEAVGDSDPMDIEEEDEAELTLMNLEDFQREPIDSKRVSRCKRCRRLKFGHPKPFGENKCKLAIIKDDSKLREDDEKKNRARLEKRNKRKRSTDSRKGENDKKTKTDSVTSIESSEDDDADVKEALEKLKQVKLREAEKEKKKQKLDKINSEMKQLSSKRTTPSIDNKGESSGTSSSGERHDDSRRNRQERQGEENKKSHYENKRNYRNLLPFLTPALSLYVTFLLYRRP